MVFRLFYFYTKGWGMDMVLGYILPLHIALNKEPLDARGAVACILHNLLFLWLYFFFINLGILAKL